MKSILILSFSLLTFYNFAQSDSLTKVHDQAKKEINLVIADMFQGMKDADSALVSSTFHENIRMMSSYTNRMGQSSIHTGTKDEFLNAVGTPHEEVWDERYSNVRINVDDNLAQIWMDYSFYVNEDFSHCGVNAFQMIKVNDSWKIIQITDTRRKSACN